MRRLAFHEALGVLNVGDLHPGGLTATEYLLGALDEIRPHEVLEVGAGIGWTTARMLKRGWRVLPLEPSEVLRRKLERTLGITAQASDFESFDGPDAAFDAIISESAFYGMDLPSAFAKVHRLLRPAGLFASLDMVWTDQADGETVATLHDETMKLFGIPVGSRQALTWSDWKKLLRAAGFAQVAERQLPPGSLRGDGQSRRTIAASALRHPLAFVQHLNHRRQYRVSRVPAGWTETWMAVWARS